MSGVLAPTGCAASPPVPRRLYLEQEESFDDDFEYMSMNSLAQEERRNSAAQLSQRMQSLSIRPDHLQVPQSTLQAGRLPKPALENLYTDNDVFSRGRAWSRVDSPTFNLGGEAFSSVVRRRKETPPDPWFLSYMSRDDAEELLLRPGNRVGTFLVRERPNESGSFCLSVLVQPRNTQRPVFHYKIKSETVGGKRTHYISDQVKFSTLGELVKFYSQDARHIHHKLTTPCVRQRPSSANLDDTFSIHDAAMRRRRSSSSVDVSRFGASMKNERTKHFSIHDEATGKRRSSSSVDVSRPGSSVKNERTNLTLKSLIRRNKNSECWKGSLGAGKEVAVKLFYPGKTATYEILREGEMMKNLQHNKIVKFYAMNLSEEPMQITMEYMDGGNLKDYLKIAPIGEIDFKAQVDISIQVASAMSYLERSGIVHRALRAENILTTAGLCCKLSDFGSARRIPTGEYIAGQGEKFALRWAAPESMLRFIFTSKADVWSFGCLLLEVATGGRTPYEGMRNEDVLDAVRDGYQPPRPGNCDHDLYQIILECRRMSPDDRPSFALLQDSIADLMETYMTA